MNIDLPDEQTRMCLWQSIFPPNAPLSANMNYALLAEKAELTGSSIKSVAQAAAYTAAAGNNLITMDIIRTCIVEEYKRNGRVIAEYELM